MPSGAVEDENRVGAGLDSFGDCGEVVVHRFAADLWHHQADAEITCGADGAEDVGEVVALIADRGRAGSLGCPDIGQAALLADPGFILPP